jgi:hypothetical protein
LHSPVRLIRGANHLSVDSLWHDRINREQTNALRADGRADNQFQAGPNEDLNYLVTQAIVQKVDLMQCRIETDTLLGDQKKKGYLQGIEKILKNFAYLYRGRNFNVGNLPTTLDVYEAAMQKDKLKEPIDPLLERQPYEIVNLLLSSDAFNDNPVTLLRVI